MIACAFQDILLLVMFYISQIALACGSCNFENFKNITRAHISRNALAFKRFSILIDIAVCNTCNAKGRAVWVNGLGT